MPMLWLNHQQIPSLDVLRRALREGGETAREALRSDLVAAAQDGRFGGWLSLQPEVRGVSMADWAPEARALLCGGPAAMSGETAALLERICGVPFPCSGPGPAAETGGKEAKAALLSRQEWMDGAAGEQLEGVADWRFVVTCQEELLRALALIRADPRASHSLYLCAVSGRTGWYRINLKGIRNTVIFGFGQPGVLHTALGGDEAVDLEAQNLRCEGFELKCIGRRALTNTAGHCARFAQKIL